VRRTKRVRCGKFLKKYGVEDEDGDYPFYDVWELAEEASRGGRFGKPDPELVFNLVIRGSPVPAEFVSAVEETYKNWKNGTVKEFNICEHITSSWGITLCTWRKDAEEEKDRERKLSYLYDRLPEEFGPLLRDAYDSAVEFIGEKTSYEEGHGGTGMVAWIKQSEMEQKNEYLELVAQVREGFMPDTTKPFHEADQKLNKTYKEIMQKIKTRDHDPGKPQFSEVKRVQRLWIPYRDTSSRLFAAINPNSDEYMWKSWLTEMRTAELRLIP
jgi:uncharacterized protein YecT (DUF1311 family)